MDKEINENSKKFLILLLIICLAFFVLIIKAFEYIPDKVSEDIQNKNGIENINKPAQTKTEETVVQQEETVETNTVQETHEQPAINDSASKTEKAAIVAVTEELEPIAEGEHISGSNEISPKEPTPEQKVQEIFTAVSVYKQDKQYVKALEELQKVSSVTNDSNLVAKSYEEIAIIYAIVKRYGTALSFAQKAYNMSPSSSREILLARLYYKTGNIDKATQRINNVLQRDFAADR